MSEIKAILGTKVDESEVDKSKSGVLQKTPPEQGDAAGQRVRGPVICPWCGALGWPVGHGWLQCHHCMKWSKDGESRR